MGSTRPLENEQLHHSRQNSSQDDPLDLFFEIQKRDHQWKDREQKNANKMYDAGVTTHTHNHDYINSSEGSPLTAGSSMEAQVAARLVNSSFYRTSNPIMRYASKRNNADLLLTFDVGKTDHDWLITPPATPSNNSFDYSNDATLQISDSPLHAPATVREVGLKNFTQRPETSDFPNSLQDKTSLSNFMATENSEHTSSSWENLAKPAISSNFSNSSTKIIHTTDGKIIHASDGSATRSYTISNKKLSSSSEVKASTHVNNSDSSSTSSAKGYENPGSTSSRITNPTSRFKELPSIITTPKTTSHPSKSTKVGGSSSASSTPKVDTTSNAKRPIVTNAPSRRPTTPTLSQNQSKPSADNGGGKRSTSIGRGAINISSNTTASRSANKPRKGSQSTTSSRAGSPETACTLPSEMPGLLTEAPPNLRTTVSNWSTSTTRGSRSTSTTRSVRQPTTPTNQSNNNNSTSRDTSRSKGRSPSRGSRSTSTTRSARQPTTPTNQSNNNNSTSRDTSRSKGRSPSTSKSSDTKSKTDGMNAITSTALRGSNNKGASNSNVLGSKMVDKVIQARRGASSTSSASTLTLSLPSSTSISTSSSSPPLPAASSSLSSLSLKSTSSLSSLSISSTASLSSLPSTLSSSSSLSSPPTLLHDDTRARPNESRSAHSESNSQLRHNKGMVKHSACNNASINTSLFKDTNPGFNPSRLNQSSKTRPMQRNGEAHHAEMNTRHMSELRAKPQKNTVHGEDTMNYTAQSNVDNAESRDVSKKPSTTIAKEVEKQHQKQQEQYEMGEDLSDFSNELNAIMRQDSAHDQYGAFPSEKITPRMSRLGAKPQKNTMHGEDTVNYARQSNVGTLQLLDTMNYMVQSNVRNAESRDVSKKPTNTTAKEVEKQRQKQQQQYRMGEGSSDFSNELDAIMSQDTAHNQYGAKDMIKVSNHVGNAESRNISRKPITPIAKEVHKNQQQQHQTDEELSDFSNELNAIMRQDSAHNQYGAFPSKDVIKVSNNAGNAESRNISKKPNTTVAKEVHKNQHHHRQASEESSDFSNELNAIMRQDKAHYQGVVPSKEIIKVSNNWMLNSPDRSMRDDSVELMHLFRQGIERYEISESPLVCQHGAPGNCDKCNNVHGKGFKSTAEVWKASPLTNFSRFSHQHPNELWKGSPF